MRNKFLFFIAGFLLLLAGCTKKADDVFDQSPDQRLADAINSIQQQLTSAPNGWKVYIAPKGLETAYDIQVGGFSYFMKFNTSGRVTMIGDVDTTKAAVSMESSYRLKAAQRPSIYFDTYSYLHIPADPNIVISNTPSGTNGTGWGSDFEFSFADEKPQGDTLRLKGNQNNSIGIMVKATKAEEDAFNALQLKASILKLKNVNSLGYFKKLTFGSQSYYLLIDESTKTIVFNWIDATGKVQYFTTGYYSTLDGIYFTNPFVDGPVVVPGIKFNTFTPATRTMTVTVNTTNGTITDAGVPLTIDKDAPKRWYQYSLDRDSWWSSYTGFTVNGVVDALNMRSVPNFYADIFWAKYNPAYDAFSIFTLSGNSLSLYGPAVATPPTFTADGRIIFGTYLGSFGTPPGASATLITNYRALITDPNGYYLIQRDPLTYDMVSKDGKTWITWTW